MTKMKKRSHDGNRQRSNQRTAIIIYMNDKHIFKTTELHFHDVKFYHSTNTLIRFSHQAPVQLLFFVRFVSFFARAFAKPRKFIR